MADAWNKLRLAMQCLVQQGSQRDRLTAAITDHLICIRLKDLPLEIRAEFASVVDRLCAGRVIELDASVKRMADAIDDAEISAMVESIIRTYDAVTRCQPSMLTVDAPTGIR